MTHYFLHLRKNDQILEDDCGFDAIDLEDAKSEALLGARELVASAIKSGKPPLGDGFIIANEQGKHLVVVSFLDVLPESLRQPRPM